MFSHVINLQYDKCLKMLQSAIKRYDDALWLNYTDYKIAVWQIVYHSLFYTNIYCSPTEEEICEWANSRKDYFDFNKIQEKRMEGINKVKPYSKEEMIDFLMFVKAKIPQYLLEMHTEDKCWPYWYHETQMEFHINNIRHLQHHTAEVIERQDIRNDFLYTWE